LQAFGCVQRQECFGFISTGVFIGHLKPGGWQKESEERECSMTEYLRQEWRHLRLYRTRNTFPIDYRILRNTAKLLGGQQ